MTTLAELQSAYATLATIFRTDLSPSVNAIKRQVDGGATYDEVADEINRVRSEFDNAYQRVFEILQQAEQLPSQDGRADFIAQLERSVNTNQSNNRATLSSIEIDARANQAEADQDTNQQAAADQGPGTDSAGSAAITGAQARNEGALTQDPPVDAEQQNADGSITTQPATATPSNAETTGADTTPTVPAAPPTLPGSPAVVDVTAVPGTSTGNTLPGTPVQGSGTLQPPAVSDASRFYVYKAIKVVSQFTNGRFTQDLEGAVLQIPITRSIRQQGVLVPVASTASADQAREPAVIATNGRLPQANAAPVPNTAPTVLPDSGDTAQVTAAPQPDTTTFGPAQDSPPTSDGTVVATAPAAAPSGEGSASTTVGGFTIKASSGSASNGVFVTVFVISRNGVQGFANNIDGIVAAAQSVQQRSLGGVVEDVAQWVAGGGAQTLENQAVAQASPGTPTVTQPVNLARES